MKKKFRNLLMLLFGVVFLVSAWQVIRIKQDYQEGSNSYSTLEQYVSFESAAPNESLPESVNTKPEEYLETTTPTEMLQTTCDEMLWPNVDFVNIPTLRSQVSGG